MPPITPRPALRAAVEVMEQPDVVEERDADRAATHAIA